VPNTCKVDNIGGTKGYLQEKG